MTICCAFLEVGTAYVKCLSVYNLKEDGKYFYIHDVFVYKQWKYDLNAAFVLYEKGFNVAWLRERVSILQLRQL